MISPVRPRGQRSIPPKYRARPRRSLKVAPNSNQRVREEAFRPPHLPQLSRRLMLTQCQPLLATGPRLQVAGKAVNFTGIGGEGARDVWAVGEGGTVLRYAR